MNRPHIGIFDSTVEASGISRHVRALAGGLDPAEFQTTIISAAPHLYRDLGHTHVIGIAPSDSSDIAASVAVASEESTSAPAQSPLWAIARFGWRAMSPAPIRMLAGFGRESRALVELFRTHPVDLLHVHVVGADAAVAAARLAGVRSILGTLHIDSSRSGVRRWVMETITNHCLDRAIAVSEATRRDWIRRTALPRNLVTTIVNGVDVEHFSPRQGAKHAARRAVSCPHDDSVPVIAAVGRLSTQKGFSYLLDAVAQLDQTEGMLLSKPHVVIAGDGPKRQALAAQAAALGISSRVHFVGALSDVRPVLEAADVFVLPSLWEAMPYALLEAMAMGVAPVATRVAGVPEVIESGRSGLLVPPGDSRALADALRAMLAHHAMRAEMGEAARRRIVLQFDQRLMVARTQQLYRTILSARSERRHSRGRVGKRSQTHDRSLSSSHA